MLLLFSCLDLDPEFMRIITRAVTGFSFQWPGPAVRPDAAAGESDSWQQDSGEQLEDGGSLLLGHFL